MCDWLRGAIVTIVVCGLLDLFPELIIGFPRYVNSRPLGITIAQGSNRP